MIKYRIGGCSSNCREQTALTYDIKVVNLTFISSLKWPTLHFLLHPKIHDHDIKRVYVNKLFLPLTPDR